MFRVKRLSEDITKLRSGAKPGKKYWSITFINLLIAIKNDLNNIPLASLSDPPWFCVSEVSCKLMTLYIIYIIDFFISDEVFI